MRKLILFLFLILLVVPIIEAKQGHMKLLAVKEVNDDYEGAIADLYLEIKDGTGRVFLDTFPLTKLDTQISTRFAKDVACSYLDMDCSNYDFIYTIKADSSIVAGPSAGGAITILTAALLEDYQLDNGVSITGTINSGGIIGTVGGIKEKIDAASENGINKVLIPEGERFVKEDRKVIEKTTITIGGNKTRENASITNKTIDLVEYGKEKGLEVIEVSDIGEALHEFTGIVFEKEEYEISIDKDYESTMSFLANKLCDRRDLLLEKAETYEIYDLEVNRSMKSILNLTSRSKLALENGKDYSAASYCFGANVELTYILLYLENNTEEDIEEKIEIIERNTKKLEGVINKRKKKTVTDLEAYAIVKERLIESEDYKKKILEENITKQSIHDLAYSFERVYSAFSWANFFDHRGREYDFNKEQLENSCHDKMAEAEERYQYVSLFYPALDLTNTRKEIDYAYDDLSNGDYELCLFKATKAKAESDVILSVSGVGTDKVEGFLDRKIDVAGKNIAKQLDKGNFPILAYSYYEYANELKEKDVYSALLYAEYALELSNLDMYFKQLEKNFKIEVDFRVIVVFIGGILIGYIVAKIPKKKSKYKPRQSKKALLGKKR